MNRDFIRQTLLGLKGCEAKKYADINSIILELYYPYHALLLQTKSPAVAHGADEF